MTITFELVELGEGYSGEYDPTNPDDCELLRLDVVEDGEEIESLCTELPVTLTDGEQVKFLQMVCDFADANPEITPRQITEIFSYADPKWIVTGIVPWDILKLFGLEP